MSDSTVAVLVTIIGIVFFLLGYCGGGYRTYEATGESGELPYSDQR
jgi:hypothetical protein